MLGFLDVCPGYAGYFASSKHIRSVVGHPQASEILLVSSCF
jgi:hypothetical protein